jgi:hypothetical protein
MLNLKIKPTKADDIDAAIELVLDLAFQNIADRLDNPSEYRRQMAAYKLVKATFSKSGD